MHQTGKSFDPAKVEKPDQEIKPEEQTAGPVKPKQVTKAKEVAQQEQIPAEIEQISVPTTEDLKKKSIEKLDRKLIDKFYFECKDDFNTINDLSKKYIEKPDSGNELKKIDLILKIVLKNPILNELPEVSQLFIQSQALFEHVQKNHESLEKSAIKHSIDSVLSYLNKDSILNASESIIENINRVGVIHKNLQISTNSEKSADSDLDKIRSKIATKQLVKNTSLLEILNDNPKK